MRIMRELKRDRYARRDVQVAGNRECAGMTPGSRVVAAVTYARVLGTRTLLGMSRQGRSSASKACVTSFLCEKVAIYSTDEGQDLGAHRNTWMMCECRERGGSVEALLSIAETQGKKHKGYRLGTKDSMDNTTSVAVRRLEMSAIMATTRE